MTDKRMSADEVVSQLSSGMTIGIGGWAIRRKPMELIRAIARSELSDLTLVTYGGPEVGLLCRLGKVRRVKFGFVSLDAIPLDPHFRKVRQAGAIEVEEYDEGMLQWGLYAAALRLPFLPTRAGMGSGVLTHNPQLKTVTDPYGSGDELVAMPALHLDAALVHLNRADASGNAQCLGPDPYFDDLYCMAAERAYVSCEQIVPTAELTREQPSSTLVVRRLDVAGVIEAPQGAGFTSCEPDYSADMTRIRSYVDSAADDEAFQQWSRDYLELADDQASGSSTDATDGAGSGEGQQ